MHDVYEIERPGENRKTTMGNKKVSRRALGEFKSRFFNELLENGWARTSGSGRRVMVTLTDKGKQMENIFSGVFGTRG